MDTIITAIPTYMWGIIIIIAGIVSYFKEIRGEEFNDKHIKYIRYAILVMMGGVGGLFF